MTDLAKAKQFLLEELAKQGITDKSVLKTIRRTPRELFISPRYQDQAYDNHPLPIGHGQTISQPFIVALMTQAAQITPEDKVLEIGTGSGYQTAILARLAHSVYTIERIKPLQNQAKLILKKLKFKNIHFRVGDGSQGWSKHAPYQIILVTAASNHLPPALVDQLALKGRLIIPVDGPVQHLIRYTKTTSGLTEQDLGPVSFVPLITQ